MLGLYVMTVTFLHHKCRWACRSREELGTEPDWEIPRIGPVMTKFRHRGTGLELESITAFTVQ